MEPDPAGPVPCHDSCNTACERETRFKKRDRASPRCTQIGRCGNVIKVPFRSTTTHRHENGGCAGDEGGGERYASLGDAAAGGGSRKGAAGMSAAPMSLAMTAPVYPPKTPARRRQSVTNGDRWFGPYLQLSANF